MDIPEEFGGRFSRERELIRRPTCVVFAGTDRKLAREVAIKVFFDRPDENVELIASFEKEVAALRAASHSALVPIIAGGEEGGVLYIAMEFIHGPTLRDKMKEKNGPFEVDQAVGYAIELATALREVHEQGIFHGHLDTRGILFKGDQISIAGYCPMTIDRLAKNTTIADGRLTIDPSYIAPEQVEKPEQVDARADVYALSVILFEMVTGERPFSAKNPLQTAMLRLSEKPPSPAKLNNTVPPILDAAVLKGLARDPAQRFTGMAEFIDALSAARKRAGDEIGTHGGGERLTGTETIAVSMSAEAIQEMLRLHAGKEGAAPSASSQMAEPSSGTQTITGMAAVDSSPPEGRLDVAATMMSVDMSKVLRPSFIFLDGPKQGTRYTVDKPQFMIGSDPTCDIHLAEKTLPRRYALVVERGGEYFVELLSGDELRINGSSVEDAGEGVQLKRGDVIDVGGASLRFIAPGEVFTLQTEVADRVIDRPKSRWPALLAATAIILVVLCGGMLYLQQQEKERQAYAAQEREREKERQRANLITKLLEEGDEFYRAGAYTEPVGANARETFQKVLELSPDNPLAKRRLADIKERESKMAEERARREQFKQEIVRLLDDGDRYFRNGQYISPPGRNARDMYKQVLDRDPSNEVAKARISEIEKILGDVLGRVSELLATAKVHREAGRFVLPKGENAYDLLQEVLRVDPANEDARNAILDMAAQSVFEGDQAKARLQPKIMKQKYLTAKALGVDPDVIDKRLEGIELMGKAQSSIIIVNRAEEQNTCKKNQDTRFLNCEELMRRVAALALNQRSEDEETASQGRFIDLSGPRKD